MDLLHVENLSKVYSEGNVAVDELSFSVSQGEILALLGPNGSGKTSTIKMVCGLLLPTSGFITVKGTKMVSSADRARVSNHISAVLEGARNVYWRMTPMQNLYYFGLLRGMSRSDIRQKGLNLLEELGLGDSVNTPVSKFSRGMQQKVALAVALLPTPSLLLLDEPTLGLDIESAKIITDKIRSLAEKGKLGIILTSHSMSLIEELANNVLMIRNGSRVAYESIDDLKKNFNSNHIVEIRVEGEGIKSADLEIFLTEFTLFRVDQNTVNWVNPDQSKLSKIVSDLTRMGYVIGSIRNRQPTLEEIFLHHTT